MFNKFSPSEFFALPSALFIILLILSVGNLRAQVTVDSTSVNGTSDSVVAVTVLTFNHTVNFCANCVLYVGVSTYSQLNVPTARVTSVTYGAQTLTSVGTQVSPLPTLPATGNTAVEIFRLVAPPTGTKTVTINLIPATVNTIVGGAISLNGVSQTTPNGAFTSNSGNSDTLNLSVTDGFNGDLALGVGATSPNAVFFGSPMPPQIEQWNGRVFFNNSFDVGFGDTKSAVSATTQLTRNSTTPASWAFGGFAVKPLVVTAAASSVEGRVLTQSGRGVSRAVVYLTDRTGEKRAALTNPFGYFRFNDVPSGENYIVSVSSKRFSFSAQNINVVNQINELIFTAQ